MKIPDHIKEIFQNDQKNLPEKLYICGECKLAFPSKENYDEHTHIDVQITNPLQCEFCKDIFENITHLFDHMLRVHKKGPVDKKETVSSANMFLHFRLTV